MNLYCSFALDFDETCVGSVGGCETGMLVPVEPTLKYHPSCAADLTLVRDPDRGHCVVGSLTGAVAS